YVATHLTGGPYLALVALLPVAVLLVLKLIEGTLRPRWYVVWLAVVLVAQAGISLEVLTVGTLFGVLALGLGFALLPDRRAALREVLRWRVLAYAVAGAVLSPFLYYLLFGPQFQPVLVRFSGDLLSPVLPPSLVALATQHRGLFIQIRGANPEDYLGVPLVALIVLFAWRYRRERVTWVMVAVVLAAVVGTFGGHLLVHGNLTSIPMPWLVMYHL